MSNSKLYQPPPQPPKPREPAMDPLLALSVKPPPAPAEELVDLTNDDGLEEWAKGGTRIMDKPAPQQQQHQPQPSFHPMVYSAPPPQMMPRRSSAAIWVVPLALFVLAVGAVMAAGGYYVYHAHDSETAAATVVETATAAPAVTETAPAAVTLTTTTTTATAKVSSAAPTTTSAITSARHHTEASPPPVNGTIRTFAAGNGKPVYVDGKQVGVGGSKISTACGRHLVAVGSGHAKSVDIPCTSTTITVGSPDGS